MWKRWNTLWHLSGLDLKLKCIPAMMAKFGNGILASSSPITDLSTCHWFVGGPSLRALSLSSKSIHYGQSSFSYSWMLCKLCQCSKMDKGGRISNGSMQSMIVWQCEAHVPCLSVLDWQLKKIASQSTDECNVDWFAWPIILIDIKKVLIRYIQYILISILFLIREFEIICI